MGRREQSARVGRQRIALATGVAITALLIVLAAASTSGAGRNGNYIPMGATAIAAVEPVEARLFKECLGLEQATALWRTALEKAGVPSDFIVRTDGGIMSSNEEGAWEAVLKHLEKGCYTYAGASNDPSGTRVFYFAGPETLAAAKAHWAIQGD